MNAKLNYLITCASKLATKERFFCPSCGFENAATVDRKYIVTSLRRCGRCELMFRAPTTTSTENAAFYQESYRQGFTSDTPTDEALQDLLANNFTGSEKDYTNYITLLAALGGKPGDRLLDFGCSWGYGSWQLKKHGYDVIAFEISKPRSRYAREKLGVDARDNLDDLKEGGFDIFFSAHVLEHVPSIAEVLEYAKKKLKKGGLFVAFTPNGSDAYRQRPDGAWSKLWNMVHPNFLDDRFYRKAFPDVLLASDPYDYGVINQRWAKRNGSSALKLDGEELMAAVRVQ
jgi:2-polyprenyl-3-methyl-5-hydroxy-6-metoxy-1,4-benzoquinol methylase